MNGLDLKGQLDIIERQLRSRAPADIRRAHDNLMLLERRLEKKTAYRERARLYLMLGVSLTKLLASQRKKPRGASVKPIAAALEYLETAYNLSVTALRSAAPGPERTEAFQLKCLCAYEWGVAFLLLRECEHWDDTSRKPPVKEMGLKFEKAYKDASQRHLIAPTSF